jgi:hypothetical protein
LAQALGRNLNSNRSLSNSRQWSNFEIQTYIWI